MMETFQCFSLKLNLLSFNQMNPVNELNVYALVDLSLLQIYYYIVNTSMQIDTTDFISTRIF